MDESNPKLKAALATALREKHRGDEHLSPELLVAYHHDRLPPEEIDAAQEHLAACRPCADLLLELARFGDDTGDEETEVADLAAAGDEQILAHRLADKLAGRLGLAGLWTDDAAG